MNNQNEIWKPVVGYELIYEVSTIGNIRSKRKLFKLNAKDSSGYFHCTLTKNGKPKTHKLHRLIAITFILNPLGKLEVNHKNGIKTDNRVENLEWTTHAENQKHAYSIGLKSNKGERHPSNKLTNEMVSKIRAKYVYRKYSSVRLAKEFGVTASNILSIVGNNTWKHI